MGKPIPGVLGSDALQSASDGFDKCGLGPRLGAAQGGFDLAPHLFNGIELWRVGWQEEDLGSGASDQGESRFAFMRAEVVHDDDITLAQGWAQHAAQIGPKNLGIGRALGRWLRLASAGKAGILLFRLAGAARRFEAVVNLADLRLRDEISLHCDGFHMGLGGDTGWMIRRAS